MTTTRKLKIWTLITHGLIIVGAGHGILFLFLLDILILPHLAKGSFSFLLTSFDNHFAVAGLLGLSGQIAFLLSFFLRKQIIKNVFQVAGLVLLWLGVVYIVYDATQDSYTCIALVTVIPFAGCTAITFLGKPVRKLYDWAIDK